MSRGRKPNIDNGVNDWAQLFEKHVGWYLRIVCCKIRDLALPGEATGIDLLHSIKKERLFEFPKKKEFPKLTAEEVPFRIPDDWSWCRLGEIVKHNSGKTLDSGRNRGAYRSMITTSNLYWGRFDLSTVKQVLIEDNELDRCTVQHGDLLICEGGDAGRAAIWDFDHNMCFQNHIHRVRPCTGVNTKFVFRYFQFLAQSGEINKHRKGMGISNLSAKSLSLIPFPLPPLSVQNKIVSFLEGLRDSNVENKFFDPLVENEIIAYQKALVKSTDLSHALVAQLSLVKQLRQAFLREAMQGKLVLQDSHDEPASELLEKIKAEKEQLINEKKIRRGKIQEAATQKEIIFDIPKSWSWCKLDDLCWNITDGTHQTPTYTKSGRIFLSAQNVKPFKFMPEKHKFVSEEAYGEYIRNRKPEKGDLLVARVGAGIGETAVIDRALDFCFYVSLGLIQPFKKYIDSNYLAYVFNSPYGILYAKGNTSSKGGSAGNFNLGRIRSCLIPVPPLSEQHRIVAKLDELMTYCDKLEQSIKQSQTQNEQLLEQVLSEALQRKNEDELSDEVSLSVELYPQS